MIRTKFFIPRLTADHVKREGLIRKLESAHDYHLTLVSAPAGYGKSTIVASWLALDENDDDFFLFLKYLIESMRTNFSTFGADLLQLFDSSEQPAIDVLTGELLIIYLVRSRY
jgi:LuxR family maltose regulon positive regulatory protein